MRRLALPRALLAAAALAGAVLVLLLAYLDARNYNGHAMRNVSVAGRDVGGLSGAELDRFIEDLDAEYRRTPIRVATAGGGFSATGRSFGIAVDHVALHTAVLRAGRGDGAIGRFTAYWKSFLTHRDLDVPVRVDVASVERTLQRLEKGRRDPVDPKMRVRGSRFSVVAGSDGYGISASALASAIPPAARDGVPITVTANQVVLPSNYTAADLQALVDEATEKTSVPLRIRAGERTATIPTAELRSWVKPAIVDRSVVLTLDLDATRSGVRRLLGSVGTKARDARLTIDQNGQVVAIASVDGTRCCTRDSLEHIEKALGDAEAGVIDLELETVEPSFTTEEASSLGVRELVASYTTKYVPGEDRVKNIHRIADLVRGTVIRPGTTFSVNRFVGPRSAANGFVTAHVIEDGVYAENFGGGISQFATTFFNAAFFGGMDLLEYQAHSLYIKRYPFGREATLSYPHPDLRVRNPTPYGIMVWSTYSASTVTVSLYSTLWVKGEQGDQKVTMLGQCKVVTTQRIRRYTDGRTATDSIRAVYRPKEGVDCQGNPTPGATTTTLKPPPTTRGPATTAGGGTTTTTDIGPGTSLGAGSSGATTTKVSSAGESEATIAGTGATGSATSTPSGTTTTKPPSSTTRLEAATTAPPTAAPTAPPVSAALATTVPPVSVNAARPAVTGVSNGAPASVAG